jgi:hypothetical protein
MVDELLSRDALQIVWPDNISVCPLYRPSFQPYRLMAESPTAGLPAGELEESFPDKALS